MGRGSSEGSRSRAGSGAIRTIWHGGPATAGRAAGAMGGRCGSVKRPRLKGGQQLSSPRRINVDLLTGAHMRRIAALAVGLPPTASVVSAQPPQGQPPAGGPGMGRRQPPPDHWMTIDSLSQTLSLSADQRTKITPAHTALNGVMKDAAAKRQAFRQQMQASGFQFGQEPTPEMRAKMDTARTEMEG